MQLELATMRFFESTSKLGLAKRRYTKDGRICASAFVQDGKTYTDCTSSKSPDGRLSGKEWCYVDPNAGGAPNWGYCRPTLDYDKVRMKARDSMMEMIVEVRKVTDLVSAQITPASQTIQLLTSLKAKQNAIDARMTQIISAINNLESNYQTLLETKSKWEYVDQQIIALENELGPLREMNANGELNKNPNNCNGLLGYEAEGSGDGLIGKYYNNEDFIGKFFERRDEIVDFLWENECPAPTINEENFSIKWSTWLRVPATGKYTFYSDSDDGNSLYVNGQTAISHLMGASSAIGDSKKNSWLDSENGNFKEGKLQQISEKRHKEQTLSASGPIYLNGGMKYKLSFLMFHSVHSENINKGTAYGRLSWSSDQLEKQLIDQNFFYTSNKVAPLKIAGLDPSTMVLSILRDNDDAFKNSEEYKLQDIPFQYQNKPSIRLDLEFTTAQLKFTTTSPIAIYIAIDANRQNPLPTDFDDQQEGFSVLRILKTAKAIDNKVKASESNLYKVYKKKFPAGIIKIPLLQTKKSPTNRLILFYSLDSAASSPISCGGETILLSSKTSPAYDKCEVSSKFPGEGWSCEAGLSGKMIDGPSSMWASNGQGIGAWMNIKFKGQYQITKIEVKDRNSERNSKLELSFGLIGAEPMIIDVKNIDEIQEFPIKPIIASEVKIMVKSVYSAINNGGAFNIYGISCMNNEKTGGSNSQKSESKMPVIKLSCTDTFRNKEELERMNIKEGDSIKILCEETCAFSIAKIYGDGIYSEDSSICKAAFHAGVLGRAGEKVRLTVVRGESFYKSNSRNGILSNGKQSTGVAIQFQQTKSKENSEGFKAGMKIDVFDEKLSKWLPGVVENSEKVSKKFSKITVSKEGYGADSNEVIQWPNKDKLAYCGEMVKNRNCDKNSTNPDSTANDVIRIAFGPAPNKVEGYVLDEGREFSKKGELEYGWSRDISNLARSRHVNSDPLTDNLILFPPNEQSKWCTEKTPQVTCESIDWTIKVAAGRYNVKVTVGDAVNKVQYDMKMNDKQILKNKVLDKNQFFTTNDDISVLDRIITIKADCEGDCKYSWSRISAIQISKLPGFYIYKEKI